MRKALEVAELKDSPKDVEHQAESCVERFRPFSLRTHFESAHWVGKNQPRPDEDLSRASPANKKLSALSARSRPSSPRFQPPGRADELKLPRPEEQDDRNLQVAQKLCKRSLQLKAELQTCETEAAALRQRLSHLGDRSKEKRRAQWERRALHKDWGSGAQTWTIWKAFAERSLQEAQKIRRIIGKVPAEALTNGSEQLEEVNAALQRAKSEVEEEQVERTKLARAMNSGAEAVSKTQRALVFGYRLPLDALFDAMSAAVKSKGPELVKMGGAVFQFIISDAGPEGKFVLDLKNGSGAAKAGEEAGADCTITMADADLVAMAEGKLDGMQAFMGGKLKIKGNMMLAQKLQSILEAAK
ncbi:unnamed protein product [Cladocopium goreaui]|uniref:SCP2 domain-containing protein n=1 Tax=Cladocopium goreaui TaxID=2562237 RepID=A0A9P1BWZ1_9DINO|nr:unnamed protein product [Cladocopium goreaui]